MNWEEFEVQLKEEEVDALFLDSYLDKDDIDGIGYDQITEIDSILDEVGIYPI